MKVHTNLRVVFLALFLGLTFSMVSIMSGCHLSDAQVPVVPQDERIAVPELKTFELEEGRRLLLNSSKFFLWPQDYTGKNVQAAREISREVDRLDDESFDVRLKQKQALEDLERSGAESARLDEVLGRTRTELETVEQDLAREEALPGGGSEQRLGELRAARNRLNQEIQTTTSDKNRADEQVAQMSSELEKLEARAQRIEEQGTDAVTRLTKNVDWRGSAASVWFESRPGGQLMAGISKWDFEDGERSRSFSTDRGTIRNVTFNPLGGRFELDVDVKQGEVWHLSLEWIRYNSATRRYFQGEITVLDAATGKTLRTGVLKLVDKKTP